MPRVYDSANDPHDFCKKCFPSEASAQAQFGDVGDGPDGRGNCYGYDAEHPDYDGTDYRCEKCDVALTMLDNGDQ
jgi:hypothetical protein